MSKKQESKVEEHEQSAAPAEGGEQAEERRATPADGANDENGEEANSGGDADSDSDDLSIEEQLSAAKTEARNNYEKYLRTVADWENYRRRMAREKDELRQYAVGSFIEELLPVLDNLELGLATAAKHPEAAMVTEGFQMVADQIRNLLTQRGLKTVEPDGEKFDPHEHESVAYHPDPEKPEGTVISVVRRGYSLNGRLLRPASVVVSSGAPQEDAPEKEEESAKEEHQE